MFRQRKKARGVITRASSFHYRVKIVNSFSYASLCYNPRSAHVTPGWKTAVTRANDASGSESGSASTDIKLPAVRLAQVTPLLHVVAVPPDMEHATVVSAPPERIVKAYVSPVLAGAVILTFILVMAPVRGIADCTVASVALESIRNRLMYVLADVLRLALLPPDTILTPVPAGPAGPCGPCAPGLPCGPCAPGLPCGP